MRNPADDAPIVHPYLAPRSAREIDGALAALALFLVGIGALPGPLVWLMNLTAVPLLLAVLARGNVVHLRIALSAAWAAALLHLVLYR